MKKASFLGLLFTAMSTAFVACSDEEPFQSGDGTGRLAIRLDVNTSAISSRPETRAFADDGKVAVEDLSLKATAIDGGWTKSWKSIADLAEDNTVDIPVGTHNIEAFFGNDSTEGFGCPYVHGAQQVKINLHETSEVGIVAELKSAMLSFTFDDALNEYLQDYNVEIISSKDNHIVYSPDMQPEPAYVMPGEINLIFNTKKKESRAEGAVEIGKPFAVEAAHHYTIKVSYNEQSAPGNAGITVTFDDALTVDDREINIDLSDQVLLTPVPEVTAAGFEPGEIIEVARGADHDAIDFNIIAMGGIDEVTIETENWAGILPDWAKTINLTALEPADQAKYTAMGLTTRGLWKNRDKMAVVQMAGLLKNAIANTDDQTPLKFTITVKSGNKVSEPVELVVKIVDQYVELAAVDGAQLHRGHNDEYQLMLEYPGTTPQETLRLSYHATNVYATIDNVTYEPAGEGKYLVKFPFDAINLFGDMSQCEFMIEAKDDPSISSSLTIPNVLPSKSAIPLAYDVYATRAYISVKEFYEGKINEQTQEDYTSKAKLFMLSADGRSYNEITEKENGYFKITDLTDNKEYTLKASLTDDITNAPAITFTTEAATQLPNSGFDNWTSEKKGDYQYLWSTDSPWSTLNALTTSTNGSGSGNGLNTGGCAYKANSGTIPANGRSTKSIDDGGFFGTSKSGDGSTVGNATLHSDKQNNGTNAALIRTIGWGSSNTASGKTSGQNFGTCDNLTPGELYLGSYDGTPIYGYDFSSRPSGIAFYYHYDVVTTGNGDYGYAEISVMDKDGNTIASATENLTEQDSYKRVEMNLNYTFPSKKAAKISIIFKSSANSDALTKDTKYWRCPGVKNVSGGEYIGSELYIDDIELIY